jgi:hypothetical protein
LYRPKTGFKQGCQLGGFFLSKSNFGDSFEKCSGHFFRQIFRHLKGIFKIWVGNTVLTVVVLFNEKHREMNATAKHHF